MRALYFDAYDRPFVKRLNAHFARHGGRRLRRGRPYERWDVPELRARFTIDCRPPADSDEERLTLEYQALLKDSVRADAPPMNPEEHRLYKRPFILPLPWFTQPGGPTFGHRWEEVKQFRSALETARVKHGLAPGARLTELSILTKVIWYEGLPVKQVRAFNDALVETFETQSSRPLAKVLKQEGMREIVLELPHRVWLDPTAPDLHQELRQVVLEVRRLARKGAGMRIDSCGYCGGLYAMWPDGPRFCTGHGGSCSRSASRHPE